MMKKLQIVLRIVGVIQLVLGLLYLFMPLPLLDMLGHAGAQPDIAYPLGMLAARFLAYGAGMFFIARDPAKHLFWINNMIFIQAIDLAVGVFYTATGVIAVQDSAFPMFNAIWIIVLLALWRPKARSVSSAQIITE
jgi:hypothetical protein